LVAELTHEDPAAGDDWTGADVGGGVGAAVVGAEDGVVGAFGDALTLLETWPVLPLWLPAELQPTRARAAIMPTIMIDFSLAFLASRTAVGMYRILARYCPQAL
jgi:hypothetical protein